MNSVEMSCRQEGIVRAWTAFDLRVLRPIQQNCEPAPIDELIEKLEARGPQEIYSMLQTVKRKLMRELRAVVRETVDEPEEIENELSDLRVFLALV